MATRQDVTAETQLKAKSLCYMCESKLYEPPSLRDGEWKHPMNHSDHWVLCAADEVYRDW